MADAGVTGITSPPWKTRVDAVRAHLAANGTNISEWARERGFSQRLVHQVLTGNRPCLRGASFKVAVALGLKDPPPPPVVPGTVERLEGINT